MYSLYGVRAWTVPKLEHYLGQYGVRRSKLLFIFIFDVHIGHKMDINSSTIIVPITRIFLTTIIYLHCGLAHIFFKRELKVTSGANKNLLVKRLLHCVTCTSRVNEESTPKCRSCGAIG